MTSKSSENKIELIVKELIKSGVKTPKGLDAFKRKMAKKYKTSCPKNISLLKTYHKMTNNKRIKKSKRLENLLKTRPIRSLSGIVNVSVLTKPYPCPGECIYCPSQKDIPQSYLEKEPAVQRAVLAKFNPADQITVRLKSLQKTGHPTDKIELRIIGGTWSYYPKKYQTWFIKECFRAANNFNLKNKKDKKPSKGLSQLQQQNQKSNSRIIGITVETRPDYISPDEIKTMRVLGITRVELGVQSIYNDVLKIIKRGHWVGTTKKATKLLKEAGFKVSYQMMPNLPGSDFKRDVEMFKKVFKNPAFRPDLLKIYPLALVKQSPLYQWYKEGKYKPYSEKELIKLLVKIKEQVPCYCRIQRVIRDIPAENIVAGGARVSNLREVVQKEMKKQGKKCRCIRCREVREKTEEEREKELKLFRKDYNASSGKEIFLSFETENRKEIYALLRLRIPFSVLKNKKHFLPVLNNSTIIREIHTYGKTITKGKEKKSPQHKGLGKKLIKKAEEITKQEFGLNKIAVISGVGVRNYFKSQGYNLWETYMAKSI